MCQECFYIARENMTSVFEMMEISDLPEMAYRHFMNYDNEVLYLLSDGRLEGVLSIGDLERFFKRQEGECIINQNYTSINSIDYEKAKALMDRSATMNEIPIVTALGELLGVIRRKKAQVLRSRQRRMLKAARTGECSWREKELRRFVNETEASVFIYTYSASRIMKRLEWKEIQEIKKRTCNIEDTDSIWSALSDQEWKTFLQSEEPDHGVDSLRKDRSSCVPAIVMGKTEFSDMEGEYYTIRNKHRFTPNHPLEAERKIFMFGPCIVFGAYCKDNQTIEAYLQDMLNTNGYKVWKVLNRGVCSEEVCYDQMFMEELSTNDIVIILGTASFLPEEFKEEIVFRRDLSEVFAGIPHLTDCMLDSVSHCNYVVNEQLAKAIYLDLCSAGVLNRQKQQGIPEKIQDYYINWSIREYFMDYFQKYGLNDQSDDTEAGAIVMNCNPFTKGHRYLIEQALGRVDKLYIFVVEEDRSCFKFEDRLRMVELGVSDLHRVHVIPSGRYIISMETFAQYFEKEQVQTVNSMDYDVYIFGEIVAAKLGIQYRFVGTEPFDLVTRSYNEALKRILPFFGVTVVEIPRIIADESEQVAVSATLVRKAIQRKDLDTIKKLCPKSTVWYLREQLKLGGGCI